LTIITVRAPGLRVPIWLPLLSVVLWGITVLVGLVMCFVSPRRLQKRMGGEVAVSPVRLGLGLVRLANVMWWSGSFTLCDVAVKGQGVRVKVRMI
jgi:hypothetical protein